MGRRPSKASRPSIRWAPSSGLIHRPGARASRRTRESPRIAINHPSSTCRGNGVSATAAGGAAAPAPPLADWLAGGVEGGIGLSADETHAGVHLHRAPKRGAGNDLHHVGGADQDVLSDLRVVNVALE